METVQAKTGEEEKRIMVSHVSSGKEPFITLLGIQLAADLVVSGHMGPPFSMIWNDFAVRSAEEATSRVEQRLSDLERACEVLNPRNRERYKEAIHNLANLPAETTPCGRGQHVPSWYLNMFNVNLADIASGYALLETDEHKWQVHSRRSAENNREGDA